MFRELMRGKQALSPGECLQLLETEKRGVLSVNGDGGYPYGMPMNHLFLGGILYFHCGREVGHRLDALRRDGRASFCLYDGGYREAGKWPLHIRSVIVFGRIEIVEDPARVVTVAEALCRKFTEDEAYIRAEIETHAARTLLLAMTPEHICGKRVVES